MTTDNTKSMTEGEAKDMILEYAVENMGGAITSEKIRQELFKNNSIEEIDFLFEKMTQTVDEVADISISEYVSVIEANEITKIFLAQGGFSATEKKQAEKNQREIDKNQIDFEKSIIDLKLKKWQVKTFWPIFIIAIISSLFGVYNFINNLSNSRDTIKQEQKMEQMEVELKKLETLISIQKKSDSLNASKALNDEKTSSEPSNQ